MNEDNQLIIFLVATCCPVTFVRKVYGKGFHG